MAMQPATGAYFSVLANVVFMFYRRKETPFSRVCQKDFLRGHLKQAARKPKHQFHTPSARWWGGEIVSVRRVCPDARTYFLKFHFHALPKTFFNANY
jgi:hypothetical protein